ncbi:hypothetical protein Syun_019110 [Stephania yunnanensis]|uniref:Uncharacterized protein n=1 Tax=Stephania yunnanensis TaxID=152371 RepID=A0AAP0NWD8_9MAGN
MAARLGGIAIVHYNNTPFDQALHYPLRQVPPHPFASDTIFKSPSDFVDSVTISPPPLRFVTRNGDSKSELLGLVSRSYGVRVGDCMEAAAAAGRGLRGTILIKRRAFGAKRGGLGAVGERGGWGGGGCVQGERCGEDSGFRLGAAVVGADGDFMVGAAMGTRFVLAF